MPDQGKVPENEQVRDRDELLAFVYELRDLLKQSSRTAASSQKGELRAYNSHGQVFRRVSLSSFGCWSSR